MKKRHLQNLANTGTEMAGQNAPAVPVFRFRVHGALAGMRLSRAVALEVSGLSVRGAKRLADLGRVFVQNRRELISSAALHEGVVIEVHFDRTLSPPCLRWQDVLWVGTGAVAIDKPAGLPVYGTHGALEGTVIPQLAAFMRAQGCWQKKDSLTLVHRIDRDTSGLLLVARNPQAARSLEEQFLRREIHKKYVALVHGKPSQREFQLVSAVQARTHPGGKKPLREARTGLLVLETYTHCSLVEARPETGRTHQIRIQLSQLGHPVLGDILYGPQTLTKPLFRAVPRQMLHASSLDFQDPDTGRRVELSAPLPGDMVRMLAGLKQMQ